MSTSKQTDVYPFGGAAVFFLLFFSIEQILYFAGKTAVTNYFSCVFQLALSVTVN